MVEDEQVLADSLDEVVCRWCGHGRDVKIAADGARGTEVTSGGAASGPPTDQLPDDVADQPADQPADHTVR